MVKFTVKKSGEKDKPWGVGRAGTGIKAIFRTKHEANAYCRKMNKSKVK